MSAREEYRVCRVRWPSGFITFEVRRVRLDAAGKVVGWDGLAVCPSHPTVEALREHLAAMHEATARPWVDRETLEEGGEDARAAAERIAADVMVALFGLRPPDEQGRSLARLLRFVPPATRAQAITESATLGAHRAEGVRVGWHDSPLGERMAIAECADCGATSTCCHDEGDARNELAALPCARAPQ